MSKQPRFAVLPVRINGVRVFAAVEITLYSSKPKPPDDRVVIVAVPELFTDLSAAQTAAELFNEMGPS
jgi:hypothetical protein